MIDKDKAQKLGFDIIDSTKETNPLYENLKRHFPQTINADGKPSLKAIATLLGINEKADIQGYELTFSGKGLANALYSTPCAKELKLEKVICHSKAIAEESQKDSNADAVSKTNIQDNQGRNILESNQGLEKNANAEVEMRNFQGESVQDFGDKNGALQGEASLESNINIQANQGRNILESNQGLEKNANAEVSLREFVGCQAGGEGVTLEGNDRSTQRRLPQNHQRDNAENTIIRGDNLDVLKLLKSAYSEKIKMIYIDPPYNTKNETFIYPDNFRKDYEAILKEVGLLSENEEGEWVESEELRFFRNITGSKSHSGWLCFMLPRLKLARDLLRDDGVIFISIDDNEQANLKILCDEIFGEENFINNTIWLKGNAQNDADTIQRNHEYILAYAKNIESNPIYKIQTKERVKAFKDEKTGKFYYEGAGLTTGGAGGTLNARPNLGFSIYYNPKTQDFLIKNDYDKELAKTSNDESEVYKDDKNLIQKGYIPIRPPKKGVGLGCWTWALEKFNNEKERIIIHKNSSGYAILKKEWLDSKKVKQDEKGEYYAIIDKENPPKSFIDFAGSGSGTSELTRLFNQKVFSNPKNTKLIQHLLKISTSSNNTNNEAFSGGGAEYAS